MERGLLMLDQSTSGGCLSTPCRRSSYPCSGAPPGGRSELPSHVTSLRREYGAELRSGHPVSLNRDGIAPALAVRPAARRSAAGRVLVS